MKKTLPEIKKIISTRDIVPKSICLILSIILWAYISNTKLGEVTFSRIPIRFQNLPSSLVISKIQHDYINVTLTGRKDYLKNVNIKNINAFVNLEDPSIGVDKSYPIEVIKQEIPEGIDLILSTKDIRLTVERKKYKKVRIVPKILDIKEGYILGNIDIDPEYIRISGPESFITNIRSMQTQAISIGDKPGKIVKEVSISTDIQGVEMEKNSVKVIIPVFNLVDLYKFEKKIGIRNTREEYEYILSTEYVSIYLNAEKEELKPSEKDIEVFIDIGSANIKEFFDNENKDSIEMEYQINVRLKKEGINIISIKPDKTSLKIIKK